MAAAPEFVTIDGHRLECAWHGEPGGETPTIVFIHEGLGSISRWREFPAALCARLGWQGLAYNRQGYGASDPLETPRSPRFLDREALDVLPKLLEAFQIRQPVLFGHSDGASIALIYAGSGRPLPAALVLEAPHLFVEDQAIANIAKLRGEYRTTDLRERLQRHHGSNTDTLFERWTQVWLSDEFRSWNIESCLPAITCPALVIQGRDDEYGTLRQMDAVVAGVAGRVERLVLDDCRHSPHIDQPAAVELAAARFLAAVSYGAAPRP